MMIEQGLHYKLNKKLNNKNTESRSKLREFNSKESKNKRERNNRYKILDRSLINLEFQRNPKRKRKE